MLGCVSMNIRSAAGRQIHVHVCMCICMCTFTVLEEGKNNPSARVSCLSVEGIQFSFDKKTWDRDLDGFWEEGGGVVPFFLSGIKTGAHRIRCWY